MSGALVAVESLGSEEERRAFAVYLGDGRRSLRRTADVCGISLGTINSWHRRHGWRTLAADADRELSEGTAETVLGLVQAQAVPSLQTLVDLRDSPDTKDSVRRQCAMDLLAMGGYGPVSRSALELIRNAEDAGNVDATYDELVSTAEGVDVLIRQLRDRASG